MISVNGWGTIATDLEVKSVGQNDAKVCKFTVVQNETIGKNQDGTYKEVPSFFRCEIWDSAAEYLVKNGQKGDGIAIQGTPRQETWLDKETGNKREAVYFRINSFRLIKKQVRTEQ